MALAGTLQDFGLADIFQLIAIQRKTGVLKISDAADDVTVYFRGGDVVFADSRHRNVEDRLGRLLVRSGAISREALDAALQKQQQSMQRLGRILVDSGSISQDQLDRALELQVAQIVYRLFRWKKGDYHFRPEDDLDLDRNHVTLISAQNLLMEGVRMIDEWPMLERRIPSLQMVFERSEGTVHLQAMEEDEDVELLGGGAEEDALLGDVLAGFGEETDEEAAAVDASSNGAIKVSQPAAQLFELVDGKSTVEELVYCTHLGEFATCRGLYELLEHDAIRPVEGAVPVLEPPAPVSVGAESPAAVPESASTAEGTPAVRRRFGLLPLGYLVLILVALGSLATMNRNPLNLMPVSLDQSPTVDAFRRLISRNRIDRVDRALYVYFLENHRFADSLGDLVGEGVLRADAIVDPWGRVYSYEIVPHGYRVLGYDNGGVEDATLSRTRRFPTGLVP